MNTAPSEHSAARPLQSRLRSQYAQLIQSWQRRPVRERRLVGFCWSVCLLLLLWLLAIRPALHTIEQARTELPALRMAAASVSAIALEAKALAAQGASNSPAALSSIDATQLQTILRQAGLHARVELATPADNEWLLHIEPTTAVTLLDWLTQVPPTLGLQIQHLNLQRSIINGRERTGLVSGQVLLRKAQ